MKQSASTHVLVSASEAARVLGIHSTTVNYMRRTRRLVPVRKSPHFMYSLGTVEALRIARVGKTKVGRRAHGVEIVTGEK